MNKILFQLIIIFFFISVGMNAYTKTAYAGCDGICDINDIMGMVDSCFADCSVGSACGFCSGSPRPNQCDRTGADDWTFHYNDTCIVDKSDLLSASCSYHWEQVDCSAADRCEGATAGGRTGYSANGHVLAGDCSADNYNGVDPYTACVNGGYYKQCCFPGGGYPVTYCSNGVCPAGQITTAGVTSCTVPASTSTPASTPIPTLAPGATPAPTTPGSTPTPTTPPGTWQACGSCAVGCGGDSTKSLCFTDTTSVGCRPASECRLSPANTCQWDPGNCTGGISDMTCLECGFNMGRTCEPKTSLITWESPSANVCSNQWGGYSFGPKAQIIQSNLNDCTYLQQQGIGCSGSWNYTSVGLSSCICGSSTADARITFSSIPQAGQAFTVTATSFKNYDEGAGGGAAKDPMSVNLSVFNSAGNRIYLGTPQRKSTRSIYSYSQNSCQATTATGWPQRVYEWDMSLPLTGTYSFQLSADQLYHVCALATLTVNKAPTANINAPASGIVGTSITLTGNAFDQDSNLSQGRIYVAKTNKAMASLWCTDGSTTSPWCLINTTALSGGSQSFSGTWTPSSSLITAAADYYAAINVYDNTSPVNLWCSGNPWCNFNGSNSCAAGSNCEDCNLAGLSYCGTGSYKTIRVNPRLTAYCAVSPRSIDKGRTATWSASPPPSGGDGSYTYSWSGTAITDGQPTHETPSITQSYPSPSAYQANLSVSSAGQTLIIECPVLTVNDIGSAWIQVTGDVHSNGNINAGGGP